MELIEMLTSKLGIKTEQAEGGMGVLLNAAKDKLPEGEFSQLTGFLPDWEKYVGAAPEADTAEETKAAGGGGGIFGKLLGMLGMGGGIGGLIGMVGGFNKLGLDLGTLQKFVPTVLEFLKGKGGGSIATILQKMLK